MQRFIARMTRLVAGKATQKARDARTFLASGKGKGTNMELQINFGG
ncbi:hypothetical protein [Sphingomonas sp.]